MSMKKILLVIFLLLIFLTCHVDKISAIDYFSNYDTHPDFWAAGEHQYTGKQYFRIPSTFNPGYDVYEVWSGPLGQDGRYVNYQIYYGAEIKPENFGPVREWEKWTSDPIKHIAYNHSYAGPSADNNRKAYSSQAICQNQPNNTGHQWPNLENGSTFTFVPESVLTNECTTSWADANHPGGYIALHLAETWSEPFTSVRISKCDSYIPSLVTPDGNQICKSSPSVGIIYQRYVTGSTSSDHNYQHGCEATIYAWGYPFNSDENYKKWFRNGELRFSEWHNMGAYSEAHAPDDHGWWDSGCSNAFTQETNWTYSGNHQFDYINYEDHGDPAPTPTPTQTPTPKPGDLNGDTHVDDTDYQLFTPDFGKTGSPGWIPADIDKNGKVDIFDYNILVGNFGK